MRVVFLGSDGIALPMLNWLVNRPGVSLVAVYTQPDRAVGRGQKVQANAIKTWALARGFPVHQPERLTPETQRELSAYGADLGLVMAYGHILKDDFIATPRLGMVNLHASILPSLRGASPIQSSIASGQAETGVSLMRIVRELDAGPVAEVERVCIGPQDTALDVEARLSAACVPLLARTFGKLVAGELVFRGQDNTRASFCRKLSKEDGVLDFSLGAPALAARINGLFPWPAVSVTTDGLTLKFGLADWLQPRSAGAGGSPGTVLGFDGEGLLVSTGEGVLRVLRLQRPGGRMLATAEFLRGTPIPVGTVLPSSPQPLLVDTKPFARRQAG